MKKLSKQKVQENITRFIASLKIQMYAEDPNIAKVYHIFQEEDSIYLVMELCVDGDLTHRLKSLRKNKQALRQMIRGVVKGLRYLHNKKILHRDLKL